MSNRQTDEAKQGCLLGIIAIACMIVILISLTSCGPRVTHHGVPHYHPTASNCTHSRSTSKHKVYVKGKWVTIKSTQDTLHCH